MSTATNNGASAKAKAKKKKSAVPDVPKISNAVYEVENGSSFLGKPYEPNAVVKNDIEFILMQRKPGGYRTPEVATRILSVIGAEDHKK